MRLIARADVLVENFSPGTLDALGLGYAQLSARHPRLIYCSITGFGATGPERDRPGYDAVIQAEGGLMSLTGPGGGEPYRLGVAIADIAAGLYAAQGITLALLVRERTGKGQYVDVGMLDAVASLLTYQAGIYFTTGHDADADGQPPPEHRARTTRCLPRTARSSSPWATTGSGGRSASLTGLGALAADERYATNAGARAALRRAAAGARRTCCARARARRGSTCSCRPACRAPRCASLDEVLADPQLLAREMIETVEHPSAGALRVLGLPIKLSDTPGAVSSAPPRLGEHTAAVLEELLGPVARRRSSPPPRRRRRGGGAGRARHTGAVDGLR